MDKEYLIIASQMYGVNTPKKLPKNLYNELIKIDSLCRKNNGILTSRQIIAIIVAKYI